MTGSALLGHISAERRYTSLCLSPMTGVLWPVAAAAVASDSVGA